MPPAAPDQKYTPAMVQELRSQIGPCPTDIFSAIRDMKQHQGQVEFAILGSQHAPEELLSSASCPLFLLRRLSPGTIDPTYLKSDYGVLTFRSTSIAEQYRSTFKGLRLNEALYFYHSCHLLLEQGEALAGVVFEGLAIKMFFEEAHNGLATRTLDFAGYARMVPAQASVSSLPARDAPSFEYRSERPSGRTLVVTRDGAVNLAGGEVMTNTCASSPPQARLHGSVPDIPVSSGYMMFHHADGMGTVRGVCCISAMPNAPFDAHLVVPAADSTTLWIVQVAVSHNRTRDVRPVGFPDMKDLVATVEEKFQKPVRVKYLLMVPDVSREDLSVQWNMGEEFGEVDAEAFIQFVRLSPAFKLEDTIRPPTDW